MFWALNLLSKLGFYYVNKNIQLTGKDEMQELREEVEKLKQMIAKK